jgi:hypothetical protein
MGRDVDAGPLSAALLRVDRTARYALRGQWAAHGLRRRYLEGLTVRDRRPVDRQLASLWNGAGSQLAFGNGDLKEGNRTARPRTG